MRYLSTRGRAPELGFDDVLLAGLAADGGLYVPNSWPSLNVVNIPVAATYAEVAAAVLDPFIGTTIHDLPGMCRDAYATFHHDAVCPLVQIGDNEWILELFHGPTLAFKDVALQLVGRMFDHVLAKRDERATIVVATSGDTGSAAIAGALGCERLEVVVLFPTGRVSEVQRRQMTTVDAPNIRTVAVEGTFDDCQDLVKAMFADREFRDRVRLSAMNSINWARVVSQVVYYVTAARSLGRERDRDIAFAVPSGNFGNVLAGWVALQMGLPISQLVVGSNTNDILTRFLHSGLMLTSAVTPTLSPSMDIQVSSNVERLMFELNGRDGGMTAEQMVRFRSTGSLAIEPDQAERLGVFTAAKVDDSQTLATIKSVYRSTGMLLDPHSAVGLAAARATRRDRSVPMVSLATAHPAKFPDAVERAIGIRPGLPVFLSDLFAKPERHITMSNDLSVLQAFVARSSGTK